MKRRDFLQYAMAASLSHGIVKSNPVYGANSAREMDRFGGWTGRKFEPTGFFRVEKDDRWWLVTPEGNAFLSFGINHLYPDLWKQAYNSEAWKKRLALEELKGPIFFAALRSWFLRTCQQ